MRYQSENTSDREVLGEQVRYVYANASRSIPFNLINPLVLLLVFWPVAGRTALVSWLTAMVVLSVVRLLHARHVLRTQSIGAAPETLGRQFMIGSTATAAMWSTGFIAIGFSLPLVYLTLFLLVLGGMAAGAFASLGMHRQAYLLFLGAMYAPVVAKLMVQGTPMSIVLTIFVVMFSGMLVLAHGVTHRILLKGVLDRLDNERLVKQLERANSRLETVNAELGTRAETDSLTGIANRRHFEQRLVLEWQRARRESRSVACIMIDVDRFRNRVMAEAPA